MLLLALELLVLLALDCFLLLSLLLLVSLLLDLLLVSLLELVESLSLVESLLELSLSDELLVALIGTVIVTVLGMTTTLTVRPFLSSAWRVTWRRRSLVALFGIET